MDEKEELIEKAHEKNGEGKIPNQEELEKELSEYLSKKYGGRVKIISPFVFPKKDEAEDDSAGRSAVCGIFADDGMLPRELESYLDSFVVKQDRAKAVLATKVCTHFNRIKLTNAEQDPKGCANRKTGGIGMIKNNVLMIGPTGVGKTYVVKLIAQKLGVPFVKGDATKFSETGYVGGDVEDLVRDLVYEADDDIGLAENGIIYVDEIDKIASSHNLIGHDVSRTGVQRALLKPMEETDVDLKVPHDPVSQIQAIEHYRKTGKKEKRSVNTKNILFIMSGAFGGLAEIIKKRLSSQGIGFEADVSSTDIDWEILQEVSAQDLIEFGFESEFVGRLPVVVVFDELTKDDLAEILRNPNNPIILSKRMDFKAYGIDIEFEQEALEKIAEKAAEEKTGARGLVSAIEGVLIPFEKALPSEGVSRFLVTPQVVDDPEGQLKVLLANREDQDMAARFERARARRLAGIKEHLLARVDDLFGGSELQLHENRIDLIIALYLKRVSFDINSAFDEFREIYELLKHEEAALAEKLGVKITFDEDAIDEIIYRAFQTGQAAIAVAAELGKRLEYGLNLVRDRSGIESFIITKEAVTDMDGFINRLIKTYYRQPEYGEDSSGTTV